MENRDRDKVSQSDRPTEAGEVNRKTEELKGGSTFGQKIHRAEEPLGSEEISDRPDRSGSSEGNH